MGYPSLSRFFGPSPSSGAATTERRQRRPRAGGRAGQHRSHRARVCAVAPSTIYAQIIGGPAMGYVGAACAARSTAARRGRSATSSGFTGAFGGFGWYFGTMAVDPTLPDKVYALGVSPIRSLDGGVNWGSILTGAKCTWISMRSGSIRRTRNSHLPRQRWRVLAHDRRRVRAPSPGSRVASQPFSQFYAITVDPSDAYAAVMGGTQDNNTFSGTRGLELESRCSAVTGFSAWSIRPIPTTVFAEFQTMSHGRGPQLGPPVVAFLRRPPAPTAATATTGIRRSSWTQ